jgi:CheY-like chemotaxis protein
MNPQEHTSILIVEDDLFLSNMLVELLELEGFKCFVAKNGKTALELLAIQTDIRCVLADIRMPIMGGLELLAHLKKVNCDAPIVMLMTGYLEFDADNIYDLGADAYFEKPFNHKLVAQQLRLAIKSKQERWSMPTPPPSPGFMIELSFDSFEHSLQHKCIQIGRGGLSCVLSGQIPKVGDTMWFNFLFNESPPFRLKGSGVVRWVWQDEAKIKAPACGIEFLHLDDEARLRITRLLTSHKTRAFIPKFVP